jgi:hypothetical protein
MLEPTLIPGTPLDGEVSIVLILRFAYAETIEYEWKRFRNNLFKDWFSQEEGMMIGILLEVDY